MLEFIPITQEHQQKIQQNLYLADGYGCEYSFANLFLWGDQRMAVRDGTPFFLTRYGKWTSYLLPVCSDRIAGIQLLREDAHERGIPLRIFGLTPADKAELEAAFPETFRFRSLRDSYDYIYEIDRLCDLRGRKLQAKRNHCNRFAQEHPDFRILPLTKDILPLCKVFAELWYHEHLSEHPYVDLTAEETAIGRAFAHFGTLQMEGIAVAAEGEIVAFAMGNRIREDTFDVNFEKAVPTVNGAYAIVNRELARRIRERYPEVRYLNREDDMGIEGLRRAKESYIPDILLEKIVAEEQ